MSTESQPEKAPLTLTRRQMLQGMGIGAAAILIGEYAAPGVHASEEGKSEAVADYSIYLMPFSHLDLYWLGEREECLSRGNRIINRAMEICQKEPTFRFYLEDMVWVKHYLMSHPEKQKELAQLVKQGRIEVAPKYAGIYASMIPGEAHVRNFMYGKALARTLLGADPQVAHQGDLPAHTPQYPQILRRSDVSYLILSRVGPRQTPLFHWQGLDGSRALTWYADRSYSWALRANLHGGARPARDWGLEEQAQEVLAQTPGPILMHWGVDLVLPTPDLVRSVKEWNESSPQKMILATPSEFFRMVDKTPDLPVIQGEAPNGWGIIGSDGSPTDGRYLDGAAVAALQNGERFATIANLLGYIDYPGETLQTAWMLLLEGMDHNANGTGEEEGNLRHHQYRNMATFAGQEILRRALHPIAENVRLLPDQEGVPLVVFNGLSWARSDIARAHVSMYGDISAFVQGRVSFNVLDSAGKPVQYQVLEDKAPVTREFKFVFPVEGVPSVGYKTYYLVEAMETPTWPPTCQLKDLGPREPLVLETDQFTLELQRPSGKVSLYDKVLRKWVLKSAVVVGEETDMARRFDAFDHYATGREFTFNLLQAQLAENGPVYARLVVRGFVEQVNVEQEWTLYKDLRRVDLTVTTIGPAPIAAALQQTLPTVVVGGKVNFGVPYGTNSFDNVMPQLRPKVHNMDESNYDAWINLREVQDWIDVSNESYGVTVATDHRMMEVKGSVILGKLAFGGVPSGRRSYRFQILPHEGDWRAARSYRWGAQLAMPLTTVSVHDPSAGKTLPAEQSFCTVSAEHVVLTVLKRSQDGKRLVWRGYEAEGRAGTMALCFGQPLAGLVKTNLLEVDEGAVAVDAIPIEPYEIVTLAATPLRK